MKIVKLIVLSLLVTACTSATISDKPADSIKVESTLDSLKQDTIH